MQLSKIFFSIYFISLVYLFCAFSSLDSLSLRFDSTALHFNNLDLVDYDADVFAKEKSNESKNTDDRGTTIFGTLAFEFSVQYKKTEFFLNISRQGYWGFDNFQGRDDGQNPILINRLYFIYYPMKDMSIHFGRQVYQIGEAHTDFFFSDVVDGLKIDYSPFDWLKANVLLDIVSLAFRPPNINIYSIIRKDDEDLNNFQGNTVSLRFGFASTFTLPEEMIVSMGADKWMNELGFIPFTYLLRYGASTQGSADLSENGRNNLNQADNDFLSLSGLRIYAKFQNSSKLDFTLGYSNGRDTQFTVENSRIYNHIGLALNYEITFQNESNQDYTKLFINLGYFHQDFASLNARSMGGLLVWGLNNYRVSPYAYFYHFRDHGKKRSAPERVDQTNSKTFVKLGGEWRRESMIINGNFLGLLQTEGSQYMGTEIELNFSYVLDNIQLTLTPAIYFPSEYYPKLSAKNPFIASGTDTLYAIRFIVQYVLDLDFIAATEKKDKKEKDKKDNTDKILGKPPETIDQ